MIWRPDLTAQIKMPAAERETGTADSKMKEYDAETLQESFCNNLGVKPCEQSCGNNSIWHCYCNQVSIKTEEVMGIFTRFMDIVNSNINALLDKAEDPEKMIRLMMQEMEDTLVDLKSSCAAKIASRSGTVRDQAEYQQKVTRWTERARLAVEKGRDDLAREALIEKKEAQTGLDELNKELDHLNQIIDECKKNIILIEEKLQTVIVKHKVLMRRGQEAKEKTKVNTLMRDSSGSGVITRFSNLENRIERMESDAEVSGFASSNLESEFSKLEAGEDVDDELAELKKSVKKTKTE